MRGLQKQVISLPLAVGINQKVEVRALQPPYLEDAIDVQFSELGGIQTRLPFGSTMSSVYPNDVITNARRIIPYGNELVMITKEAVYSWDAQLAKWVSRGTHLAVKVSEEARFVTTGDQVDADRAEMSNTIIYAWTDNSVVYVAAVDKTTGSVVTGPTATVGSGGGTDRPRVVALSTKILLLYQDIGSDTLVGHAIDPADPATGIASAVTVIFAQSGGAGFDQYYDAVKIPGADTAILVARRVTTTSYEVLKVTAALAVTQATKARTANGPLAVSVDPTGAEAQVIRGNGTAIQGDLLTVSSLADSITGQAIGTATGTPVNNITCAHKSTTDSGEYRCHVFWTAEQEAGAGNWLCETNWVDTGGTISTESTLVRRLGLASRAFEYNNRIYVWGVFAGESSFSGASPAAFRAQLQNTYFLYRDDSFLVAKSAAAKAGGFATVAHLPGVALTSGTTVYSWCGTERRVIPFGGVGQSGYADRGPRDITFEFDSNEARRCVRIGQTLYIACGEGLLQFDGVGLYETGFHIFPWYFGAIEVPAGNLVAGDYALKCTDRWDNAKGEIDRSTTATHGTVTMSGTNGISIVTWMPNYITHKTNRPIARELWRTAVNPTADAPFYLVTSKDPAATTNPNRYVPNDTTLSVLAETHDEFADSVATTKETNNENGDVLESLPPPPASIVAATDTRVFLAGVAGDPHRVWYSKQRAQGEVVAFHDALTFAVPAAGGDITGLIVREGVVVVYKESAVYELPGDGYDNLGQGLNYGPARMAASDVGAVSAEAIVDSPIGVIFKSAKGWYRHQIGGGVEYIGGPVSDYDSETVYAIHVLEDKHEIRILTSARMLVFDYVAQQWGERTISNGLHAAVWNGTYYYLTSTGPKAEATSHGSSVTYGIDIETAWIKLSDLQGWGRVYKMMLLGEYRSACYIRVRIAYNYDDTWIDDRSWPAADNSPRLQVAITPTRPQCEAIKLRLSVIAASTFATATATPPLDLSIGDWTATLTSVYPRSLILAGEESATALIDVRDHAQWDTDHWIAAPNICGIHVTGNNTTATIQIGDLEAAINARSSLVQVTSNHAQPTRTIDFTGSVLGGIEATFTVAYPTGEAVKLTGLDVEVGLKPRRYPTNAASSV